MFILLFFIHGRKHKLLCLTVSHFIYLYNKRKTNSRFKITFLQPQSIKKNSINKLRTCCAFINQSIVNKFTFIVVNERLMYKNILGGCYRIVRIFLASNLVIFRD